MGLKPGCTVEVCEHALADFLAKRALALKPAPGPSYRSYEVQDGSEMPVRLSFQIKVF